MHHPSGWGLDVDGHAVASIDQDTWQALAKEHPEALRQGVARREQALLLERVLWSEGIWAIESINLGDQEHAWQAIYGESWLLGDGRIAMGDRVSQPERLGITQPWETARATNTLCDLTPTLAGALGIRSPLGTSGRALGSYAASRVYVISIDGLGARFFSDYRGQGILRFLDTLGDPKLVQGMYPSCSTVNLAAWLTGAKPAVNGIQAEQDNQLLADTLLDSLAEAGASAILLGDGQITPLMADLGLQSVDDQDSNGVRTEEVFAQARSDHRSAGSGVHVAQLGRALSTGSRARSCGGCHHQHGYFH